MDDFDLDDEDDNDPFEDLDGFMDDEDDEVDEDDEDDDLIIQGLHLRGPQLGPDRVFSNSFPDNSFYGSSKGSDGGFRSLPQLSGSLQFVSHPPVPKALHNEAAQIPHHRENLATTNVNTLIFGDNLQGRRVRNNILDGFELPDGWRDRAVDFPTHCLEPFIYASWMIPLHRSTSELLEKIAFFTDDNKFRRSLIFLSSTFLFCHLVDRRLTNLTIAFGRVIQETSLLQYCFRTSIYKHHVPALEGLILSNMMNSCLGLFNVRPETRLGSLLSLFFLTLVCRKNCPGIDLFFHLRLYAFEIMTH